jgi:hypothetical protein
VTAGTDSHPDDPHVEALGTVRQVTPPPAARALSTLCRVDYEDAFLVETGPAQDRTGEQWARAILEDAPMSTRNALSRGWSALGLRLGSTQSDRFVLGWEVRRSTPDVALLGASGRLGLSGELLFECQQHTLLFANFVQLENRIARALWAGIAPRHRQVVRDLLEQAIAYAPIGPPDLNISNRASGGMMEPVEPLAEQFRRRAFECRLTPDRALETVAEAEAFLRDRGLLTRTADCALPSLYEACHEDPYKAGSPGFATWPATKWPWFGELAGRGYLIAGVHRGKNLLVSSEVAGLLDPICRAEIGRMRAADPGWRRLLDHLAAAGPSSVEDLRVELRLKRQELNALRSPLERCGAIISRSLHVTAGEGHSYSSELARWDQAYPGHGEADADPGRALADLVAAGVRAAVVAPERELRRWFSWQWYWTDTLVDGQVRAGRLRRVDGHLTMTG